MLSVSEDAITVLYNMLSTVVDGKQAIKKEINVLKSAYEENAHGLGYHSGQIQNLIDQLDEIADEGSAPIKMLVYKLKKSIFTRIRIMQEQRYKHSHSR